MSHKDYRILLVALRVCGEPILWHSRNPFQSEHSVYVDRWGVLLFDIPGPPLPNCVIQISQLAP